ncbi:hypothetical protein KQJ29_37530, partial [Enterococcus sp. S181_ASV_20]|nr:hypothetical protein [Enterococcus sp. S181_ASV_20]
HSQLRRQRQMCIRDSVETVHHLLRTAVSRIEKEVGVQLMQRMKFELLFGTCATFINFQKLTWAKEVLVLSLIHIWRCRRS